MKNLFTSCCSMTRRRCSKGKRAPQGIAKGRPFDRGLVGVATNRTILVPASVRDLPGNEFLRDLHGQPIREAKDPGLRVLEKALKRHRENILVI